MLAGMFTILVERVSMQVPEFLFLMSSSKVQNMDVLRKNAYCVPLVSHVFKITSHYTNPDLQGLVQTELIYYKMRNHKLCIT